MTERWIEELAHSCIKELMLTPSNLYDQLGGKEARDRYLVYVSLPPNYGKRALSKAVKDLSPADKQRIADALTEEYSGLPDNTSEGIYDCLYTDVQHVRFDKLSELGAMCGLLFVMWRQLREQRTNPAS